MDDLMFLADSLSELKKKIEEFLWFFKHKNQKLKSPQFIISEEVEFAGSVVLAELVREDKGLPEPQAPRDKKRNLVILWYVK